MVLSSGKLAYHPPNPFIPTPLGFTHPKDHKPSLRSKTIFPIHSNVRMGLNGSRGSRCLKGLMGFEGVDRVLIENKFQVRVEKCFLCLSSLLLFIARRAVGVL